MLNPAGRCQKASLVRWRHRRGRRKQLQAKTGGSRRLLHGRWVGRMAAGWQDQLDRRRGSGRQGGSQGPRPSETSLFRRTAASFCAFLDRPTMGDQTSSSSPPPQSPGFGPMPTLQPAHLAAQRKNGTPRPRRDCRPTWQRRAIQHSGAASCAPRPVATGHSTPGPGSTAARGPQPGRRAQQRLRQRPTRIRGP